MTLFFISSPPRNSAYTTSLPSGKPAHTTLSLSGKFVPTRSSLPGKSAHITSLPPQKSTHTTSPFTTPGKRRKYYVVSAGKRTGVFDNWLYYLFSFLSYDLYVLKQAIHSKPHIWS